MAEGALDARGIWQYGEDDPASPFSALLNMLAASVSTQIGNDRARLSALENAAQATAWDPAVTGITVGNGSEVAKYATIGDVVDWSYKFVLGTTSAVTSTVFIPTPADVLDTPWINLGSGYVSRGTSTTGRRVIVCRATTSGGIHGFNLFYDDGAVAATSPLSGGTWQSGDVIACGGRFFKP